MGVTQTTIAVGTASWDLELVVDIHTLAEVAVVGAAAEDILLEPWPVAVQKELIQRMMLMHTRTKIAYRKRIVVAAVEVPGASFLPKNNCCTAVGHRVLPEAELALPEVTVLQSSPNLQRRRRLGAEEVLESDRPKS